jgi:glycosidase
MKLESPMAQLEELSSRLRPRLQFLYGARADECLSDVLRVCSRYEDLSRSQRSAMWDERDVILISYADQVRADNEHPLSTLRAFLHRMNLLRVFRVLHLLPFYPATSDDGFSVVDYRQVDPGFGGWDDINELREQFDLMFDLVLNHASCQNDWFQQYLRGVEPYTRFFVEADAGDDLSRVVRPRTSPLLTPFDTSRGNRNVWTTFSADQVDLNYQEPGVLVEMLDVLLDYIRRGARVVRLDAIAFLWKEPGTNSLHLPQTHQIVKFFRDVVDALAPGTILLTETNVPHVENASYWGNSDESHMIYNFSLPPLLLDALLTGDGTYLNRWLAQSVAPPPGTTLLNFTASHDGIGVRPLEALVPSERVEQLVSAVQARQGLVSRRVGPDGSDTPYELNITYFDALSDPQAGDGDPLHVQRFMASQALMLSLRGIPAVYFHSLLGTPNDLDGVQRTGRPRSINRRKFQLAELMKLISDQSSHRQIWETYIDLLKVRVNQPEFHPDASQDVLPFENQAVVAFLRTRPDLGRAVLVVANVSSQVQTIDLKQYSLKAVGAELICGKKLDSPDGIVSLNPYQVVWLPVHRE